MDSELLIETNMNNNHNKYFQPIIKSVNGTFIDLENNNFDNAIVGIDLDLRNRQTSTAKIDFIANLYYELAIYDWMELVFSLYRYDEKGNMQLLSTLPYKILLNEELEEDAEDEPTNITVEKNEFIALSYSDSGILPGVYRYVVKAEINYINVNSAQIQTSTLSVIAQ